MLLAVAERAPGRRALKLDDREVSYGALDASSARLARLLDERGLKPGDRVAVLLPNVPELVVAYCGTLRAGCVVVPLAHAPALRDSAARLTLAWHGVAEAAEAAARAAGSDFVFVTPGEFQRLLAGFPAERGIYRRAADEPALAPLGAAALSHGALEREADSAVSAHLLSEHDVVLTTLPLLRSIALLHATLSAGGCLTLLPEFEPGRALALVERDGVTVMQADADAFKAMAEHPRRDVFDLSTLRLALDGSLEAQQPAARV